MHALSRRLFVGAGIALPAAAAWAQVDIQPLARVSHFPQMPSGGVGVTACGSFNPPANIPSFGRIASISEPGEQIEISGTVYRPDRSTPAADITIFAYHTDINGHYNSPNNPFNPRIYGWVKTGSDGRYGFRTIKPAPYADHSTPSHIHADLFGPDVPEYWVDDYWFEGDPLITPRQLAILTGRGGGGETVRLEKGADGVLRGTRDFVLQHVAVAGDCKLI